MSPVKCHRRCHSTLPELLANSKRVCWCMWCTLTLGTAKATYRMPLQRYTPPDLVLLAATGVVLPHESSSEACRTNAQDNAMTDGAQSGIILCGQKEMNDAVVALVQERGVSKESIITNL